MQEIKKEGFEFWVFYSNPQLLKIVDAENPTGFIVDLERKGKHLRQSLYDTQISEHTIQDLEQVKKLTSSKVICRINPQNEVNKDEINQVLDTGVDELLLPMVRSCAEVEQVLQVVNNRAEVGIMLETNDALQNASEFNQLPLSRCYVGLNDLAIENGHYNIFTPMVDGTLERLSNQISKKLGVAGLTHPQFGDPIPCQVLIRMMKMFDCSFGILRRSFYRDLSKTSAQEIFAKLKQSFATTPPLVDTTTVDKHIIMNAAF